MKGEESKDEMRLVRTTYSIMQMQLLFSPTMPVVNTDR